MKIVILTSSLFGTASHHLDVLVNRPELEIKMVIFSEGRTIDRKKFLLRKIKKIFRIGVLGTLNGIRMRKWYGSDLLKYMAIESLEKKCADHHIPFFRTPSIGDDKTVELFRQADADLGISMGNGYIPRRIFEIPSYGMINIHHELLPEYQNAQSVIWQIYNGSANSGYTIHKINARIDGGDILLKEEVPIVLRGSLADTVTYTYKSILDRSAAGLLKVIDKFDHYSSNATPQKEGKHYTTPGIRQFMKMIRQYKKLKAQQRT